MYPMYNVLSSCLSTAMKSIVDGFKESDKLFVELEIKRMKYKQEHRKVEHQLIPHADDADDAVLFISLQHALK